MVKLKALGKNPPENLDKWFVDAREEHYRQALIEAADELTRLANRGCGFKTLEQLAKKLRISAGEEV